MQSTPAPYWGITAGGHLNGGMMGLAPPGPSQLARLLHQRGPRRLGRPDRRPRRRRGRAADGDPGRPHPRGARPAVRLLRPLRGRRRSVGTSWCRSASSCPCCRRSSSAPCRAARAGRRAWPGSAWTSPRAAPARTPRRRSPPPTRPPLTSPLKARMADPAALDGRRGVIVETAGAVPAGLYRLGPDEDVVVAVAPDAPLEDVMVVARHVLRPRARGRPIRALGGRGPRDGRASTPSWRRPRSRCSSPAPSRRGSTWPRSSSTSEAGSGRWEVVEAHRGDLCGPAGGEETFVHGDQR